MADTDEFVIVTELDLQVDDDDETERSPSEVIDDEVVRLLRRENRVALARAPARQVHNSLVGADRRVYDVPLMLVLHAHPECTFSWARLLVDFSSTPDTTIIDMAPREVQDLPVESTTTVGLDLAFSVASAVVDVGATPEVTRRRTVYYPSLLSSGVGFRKAYWDFYPKGTDYLHADKELRLLVDTPALVPVTASVTLRARVRFRGMPRLIPLLARTRQSQDLIQVA